jgi:hypothetical protein
MTFVLPFYRAIWFRKYGLKLIEGEMKLDYSTTLRPQLFYILSLQSPTADYNTSASVNRTLHTTRKIFVGRRQPSKVPLLKVCSGGLA